MASSNSACVSLASEQRKPSVEGIFGSMRLFQHKNVDVALTWHWIKSDIQIFRTYQLRAWGGLVSGACSCPVCSQKIDAACTRYLNSAPKKQNAAVSSKQNYMQLTAPTQSTNHTKTPTYKAQKKHKATHPNIGLLHVQRPLRRPNPERPVSWVTPHGGWGLRSTWRA